MRKRLLFLCTGNAARSQMAEALTNAFHGDKVEAVSCGSRPTGWVHPLAVRAMADKGVDIRDARSKHADEFRDLPFDIVDTVSTPRRRIAPLGRGRSASNTGRSSTPHSVPTILPRDTTGSSLPVMSSRSASTRWSVPFDIWRRATNMRPTPLFPLLAIAMVTCSAPPVAAQSGQRSPTPRSTALASRVTDVARGLEHPWGLAFLPDGRMLVTERPGRLRIVTHDGRISPPLSGVPEVQAQGQGGLLDVALDPRFTQNRIIYLSYPERD